MRPSCLLSFIYALHFLYFQPTTWYLPSKIPRCNCALGKLHTWTNNNLVLPSTQPRPPPTEGAVGGDEVLALGDQPQVTGVFIATVVRDENHPALGQGKLYAGSLRIIGEEEVTGRFNLLLHHGNGALVIVGQTIVGRRTARPIKPAHITGHGLAAANLFGHLLVQRIRGLD